MNSTPKKITDSELDRRLAALARTADTPEALWPAIETRITRRARLPWFAGAAATVAVTVLGILLLNIYRETNPNDAMATLIYSEIEAMQQAAPDIEWAKSAGFNESWEGAWQQNQTAIEELEQALKRNPDNRLLMDFLARARLRQSELVNQITTSDALENQRSI